MAKRIREARERLGLTEASIAKELAIPASEYYDMELHDDEAFTTFAVAHLGQLASLLHMSVQEMLFGPNHKGVCFHTSFAEIAERLASLASAERVTIEELGDRIGWELGEVVRNPECLGTFNLVGLRDLCTAIRVDWVSALPTPRR